MSKTYLRYEESCSFGVVASSQSNVVVDSSGLHVVSSGVQDVLVWKVSSGELVHRFLATDSTRRDPDAVIRHVTCLALSESTEEDGSASRKNKYVVAGYACGSIRVWEYDTRAFVVLLTGHKVGVTALNFNHDGTRLVSGSLDTDVVIWDMVSQTGLFRLRGHKQQITDCWFLGQSQLVTASKDSLIKLWDLETQSCAHTFVGHRSPVWSIAVSPDQQRILTASSDHLLRALAVVSDEERQAEIQRANAQSSLVSISKTVEDGKAKGVAEEVGAPWKLMGGSLPRQSTERAQTVRFSRNGRFVACQTAGKTLEVYRVRTKEEVDKKIKRRLKRLREKKKKAADGSEKELEGNEKPQLGDELQLLAALRTDHRMRSFGFGHVSGDSAEIVVSFNTNCMEVYSLHVSDLDATEEEDKVGKKRKRDIELKRTGTIELQGHRNDIRAIAISSDDTLVLSAASGAVKLWNVNSNNCIRTFPSGYSLCCAFVPGDMHALVGTKSGHLLLYNLATGEVMQELAAHEDAIWSIDIRPDGKGFATGSADKQVKFWEFELVYPEHDSSNNKSQQNGQDKEEQQQNKSDSSSSDDEDSSSDSSSSDEDDESSSEEKDDEPSAKLQKTAEPHSTQASEGVLDVVHVRTLKMSEDVMCVKYSHHKSTSRLLIAVALLDCTVKVFFEDSLRFALSLYGHKLPVLSMDISSDNTLIVTGSADKNIKVWGLDFGDCHKSFFAHDAAVMSVRFAPKTHYFFSAGKDNRVRYWDADKFEMILSLERHVSEVWSLAIASDASFVVSCGHDKALRVWERTSDIVFLEEEREKELERKFDAKLLQDADLSKTGTLAVDAVKELAAGEQAIESGVATRRTNETIRAGERLMEAIEIADQERDKLQKYEEELEYARSVTPKDEQRKAERDGKPLVAPPQPNILLLGRKPTQHVLHVLRGIKSNELDEALILLPFSHATALFYYLEQVFVADTCASRLDVELAAKVTVALLRAHFKQIVATHTLKTALIRLQRLMRSALTDLQDVIGTNMVAVRALKDQVLESAGGMNAQLD